MSEPTKPFWPFDYGQTAAAHPMQRPNKISSCCGIEAKDLGVLDSGECPQCHEPCEFVDPRGCGDD